MSIKRTYHDVMCETLAEVAPTTVASERDCAEQHLHPSEDGVRLPYHSMQPNSPRSESLLVYVELEVNAQEELQADRDKEDARHLAVRPGKKRSPAMRMAKNIAGSSKRKSETLEVKYAYFDMASRR